MNQRKAVPAPSDGMTCRDCVHSRNYFNRSFFDGHFIFCECDFQRHSMFLDHDRCDNFKKA